MADGAQIKSVSIRHDAIMDFMMANPQVRLGDIARHFGMSQSWLSCVIHSDAFQAELSKKKEIVFNGTVLPLKEKMMSIAHEGLDKLEILLPLQTDAGVVSKITGDVLDRLGYSGRAPGVQFNLQQNIQNNNINTLKEELLEAQKLLGRAQGHSPGQVVAEVLVDGHPAPIGLAAIPAPFTKQVQRESLSVLGQGSEESAFQDFEQFLSEAETGDSV